MVFGSFKEGIFELLDAHLGSFRAENVIGLLGVHLGPKA